MQPPPTPHTEKGDEHIQGFPDPFGSQRRRPWSAFIHTLAATTLVRCWHLIILFGAWATLFTVWNAKHEKHPLLIQPTLLTIVGTVIGFVISYRTTSSFERYNEGRRYWSQIVLSSRVFARTVWFHIPEQLPGDSGTPDQIRAKVLIEKKTVINLLEAFAIAVKHYLRGEDGIFYTDLYHLLKFLPAYALPQGIPSKADLTHPESEPSSDSHDNDGTDGAARRRLSAQNARKNEAINNLNLPLPVSTPLSPTSPSRAHPPQPFSPSSRRSGPTGINLVEGDEGFLMPARMPPKYSVFDVFPFSLLVKELSYKGKEIKGKKAARMRARMRQVVSHNLPLEISLYLSSYISAMQIRKTIDAPTTTLLYATLNQLVDALTGLERILTTPIPPSYSIHLWSVTVLYILVLPFQIWATMKWFTIPATMLLTFIFFGFIVAGEEIENPFGYDKNDLNMDHFVHNIIRRELRAITATPAPLPDVWAFSPDNDLVFARHLDSEERVRPAEWVQRGPNEILAELAVY